MFTTICLPDLGFVNTAGVGFDDTNPAGLGFAICSRNCLNSMNIYNSDLVSREMIST